jgi:superfamily II DNA or RNA helicase
LNPKALLTDRLYVNEAYVTDDMLSEYEVPFMIGTDPYTKEPIYSKICHYERIQISHDESMIAFNRGDLDKMQRVFSNFEIVDQRISIPMKASLKIRFNPGKSWRSYQPDAVMAMTEKEHGILEAPPRSGKTLLIAAAICMNREKAIVFAHQTDLLLQLFDTFEEFTNLNEIKTSHCPVVGFPESMEDFETLDVALCTKQTFDNIINRSKARVVQKLFGAVYVDEAHYVGGEVYSQLINRFHSRIRQGVTATPRRKDNLHIVVDGILGGIIHKITRSEIGCVPMEVTTISTDVTLPKKDTQFVRALSYLSQHEARNELILGWMQKDVSEGHRIIAVTDRKPHGVYLRDKLRERGIVAEVFNGTVSDRHLRKKILGGIRHGDTKVLIVMRGMCTGLDIPAADCFYNLLPSANSVAEEGEYEGGGGYEQQCTRVLTPHPGKKCGIVRDFVDNCAIGYATLGRRKKTYTKLGAVVKSYLASQEKKNQLDLGSAVDSTTF